MAIAQYDTSVLKTNNNNRQHTRQDSHSKQKKVVHWHPSVINRHQSRRRRQLFAATAIIVLFSSIVMILARFMSCSLTTGTCPGFDASTTTSKSTKTKPPGSSSSKAFSFSRNPVNINHSPVKWNNLYGKPRVPIDKTANSPIILAKEAELNTQVDSKNEILPASTVLHDMINDPILLQEPLGQPNLVLENTLQVPAPAALIPPAIAPPVNIYEHLTEEEYLQVEDDYSDFANASPPSSPSPVRTLQESLDPSIRYLTYLPFAGITNQFYGILRAVMLAKALDRTLIIPPITASSHDKSRKNQPWSKFFQLSTFVKLTGIKVIEYQDLIDFESRSNALVENLDCYATCGFGSSRTLDFTAKEFARRWRFNVSTEPLYLDNEKDEKKSMSDVTLLEELIPVLEQKKEERLLCVSNAYKLAVPKNSEFQQFGQYFYFTTALKEFVEKFLESFTTSNSGSLVESTTTTTTTTTDSSLETLSPPPQTRTPFIAIHARRGDFIEYCQSNFGHQLEQCLPTTEQLATKLINLQNKTPSLQNLPVFVATNEDRPEELAKFRALGWIVLDHSTIGTVDELGVFGPMMVEQVLMADARALIGVRTSTFSRVAAFRQGDWYSRPAYFM